MSSTVYLKNGYPLNVVSYTDIANELNYENDTERIIIRNIIKHIETKAGETIKDNKTVLIPYIGSLRKSAVKREFRKERENLKTARTIMTPEVYKKYVKATYYECVDRINNEEDAKRQLARLVAYNRKKYNQLFKSVGETFAKTWIYSLSLVEVIEFNQEVEDMFKEAYNEINNRKLNNRR